MFSILGDTERKNSFKERLKAAAEVIVWNSFNKENIFINCFNK